MNNEQIVYPIRVNRYLYLKKICSRRAADRMIVSGQILVNNKQARLGQKIEETDVVSLTKNAAKNQETKTYIACHKPRGVVSHDPQPGEKSVVDFVQDVPATLSPLGRLDKASRGLMLLSNDGTIVNKLLHPQYEHEKEYLVTVDKRIHPQFMSAMERGVNIEGYKTKPARITKKTPRTFQLILTEGKKHQIRRMCAALGYQVVDLQRTRIQNIALGSLSPGSYREIKGRELLEFMKSINH